MNVLYIDCDSLRPDHLGCYGYHRDTSPNIDMLANRGKLFTNHYASDTPCLPSRTALFTGRFGFHTGVVNHGGLNADPRPIGSRRDFGGLSVFHTWPEAMQRAGYNTALISPFPSRHGAYHVLDGFDEWIDTGENGRETAEEVSKAATTWLDSIESDDWYLHLNFWDPHTPYRTPLSYGEPFVEDPAPAWLTDEMISVHRDLPGPFSARDLHFYWSGVSDEESVEVKERMPDEVWNREEFSQLVNGYDTGVRYMDDHIGVLLDTLYEHDVIDETLIIVTADHGESLGERNVYADHATADDLTANLPLIIAGPGVESGVDTELRYHLDLPPTVMDLVGGESGHRWDGNSFAHALTGTDAAAGSRTHVVTSTAAWAVERAVRWDDYLLIRSYHDAYKNLPPTQLFDIKADPHLTTNLAKKNPELVARGIQLIEAWKSERLMHTAQDRLGGNPDSPRTPADPLWEVLTSDSPFHPSGLSNYLDRLRETDRSDHAETLERTQGFIEQSRLTSDS